MLGLMSEEEFDFWSVVVEQLRCEIHTCNMDLHLIERDLNDQLDPPTPSVRLANTLVKEYLLDKRLTAVRMILDLREVLVSPPSLETLVVSYALPFLSFSYI